MAIKTYKRGDKTLIAENFSASEFDCHGRGCCNQTPIDEKLVEYLQNIRTHFGKPVIITAYRCPVYNAKVPNAAKKSLHMQGMAADFHIDGVAPAEIAKYAESIGVLGIGLYDTFVHIDTRTTKGFWYSHAQVKRTTFGGTVKAEGTQHYNLSDFVRDVQSACGATVNGLPSTETLSKTPTVSARKNNKHPVVKFVQKRLFALGYKIVGEADGIAGKKFEAAITAFQEDNKCWVDGEITARNKTWRKLLGME